ncbi:MAG: biosynthetic arginine decarboxylase [Natronospirillum sp.]|nr:biosynthetic arginine decarboxylase [Natronospirillum sp.]MCH8551046.1 biosynthetic arginine decarboxylase [Natronospirillum sp.]
MLKVSRYAPWTATDSLHLYNMDRWSAGYFGVTPEGDVAALDPKTGHQVSLPAIITALREQGLSLPVLVRFPHILHDRVHSLVDSFQRAIALENYHGRFTPVYPIKVNQQFGVVREIVRGQKAALDGHMGLEAGSKPELLAVLALSEPGRSTIVCNGYKDRDYIRLALVGQRLGHKVFLVLEKSSELNDVLSVARELGVKPRIGVRARLSTIGKGNWQDTGGPKSKFGLSASEILHTVEQLRQHKVLDSFQLLHFHLGSQIANIQDIQVGLREAARFYSELRLLGVPIEVVDVGGGLGVDYEGTASRSTCSINYSLDEYAKRVVHAFRDAALANDLPQPDIISESGRAMTAHHAVLLTNVIGVERPREDEVSAPDPDSPLLLHDIWRNYQTLDDRARSLVEIHHDLVTYSTEINQAFALGQVNLAQRADGEQVLRATALSLMKRLNPARRPHRVILDELNEQMADRVFANFSLFQSLPDAWGVDQVFPVVPLQNLEQQPLRRAVVRDITCDSDGRIDHYVDDEGVESTLPCPPLDTDSGLLGFFLVGAYQEILGDLHNLFGDTNSVDVLLDEEGKMELHNMQHGDSVRRVLSFVNFDPDTLLQALEDQVSASGLDEAASRDFMQWLREGMDDSTYLDHGDP